jgi:hypothetical protein
MMSGTRPTGEQVGRGRIERLMPDRCVVGPVDVIACLLVFGRVLGLRRAGLTRPARRPGSWA